MCCLQYLRLGLLQETKIVCGEKLLNQPNRMNMAFYYFVELAFVYET